MFGLSETDRGVVMKKAVQILLCTGIFFFSACAKPLTPAETNDKYTIVTTIFPEYDWVMNILGDSDRFEVTLLMDNGSDLHSFQPSAADLITLSEADIFVYVGGESDAWVEDALKGSVNPEMKVIRLLDVLGEDAREEEIKEGMEAEEHEHEEHDEHEAETDEHVWLSLRNTVMFAEVLCTAVSELDPSGKDTYHTNTYSYISELNRLDEEYSDVCSSASRNTILVADRFPFLYLVKDYDIDYYAAFVGCSAETEASFATVRFLADKLDELSLPYVIKIDGSDGKIAETVIRNSQDQSREILVLDSMQGVSKRDIEQGTSYLSIMEKNLEVLKTALGA